MILDSVGLMLGGAVVPDACSLTKSSCFKIHCKAMAFA